MLCRGFPHVLSGAAMTVQTEYRVVGIRADESRMVICEHLTRHQAERTKQAVASEHIFPSVEIEVKDSSSNSLDLVPDK